MANSDYTFKQVVDGTGSFSQSGDTGYSGGVATLQTCLIQIGYAISDKKGYFQSDTKSAVEGFQYEFAITVDGIAGPKTCLRLNTVHSSKYFNMYGKPLTDSQWGQDNILKGDFNDIDLLSRIILSEGGYSNIEQEKGVALVIKNRTVSNDPTYVASEDTYPNASIYARVVGAKGQYETANAGNTTSQEPRRGVNGNQGNGFIDPAWKEAVNLATNIVNNTKISVTGYKVNGIKISTQKLTVNTTDNKLYLNQQLFSSYKKHYEAGEVSSAVQPLAFSTDTSSDVIYKM